MHSERGIPEHTMISPYPCQMSSWILYVSKYGAVAVVGNKVALSVQADPKHARSVHKYVLWSGMMHVFCNQIVYRHSHYTYFNIVLCTLHVSTFSPKHDIIKWKGSVSLKFGSNRIQVWIQFSFSIMRRSEWREPRYWETSKYSLYGFPSAVSYPSGFLLLKLLDTLLLNFIWVNNKFRFVQVCASNTHKHFCSTNRFVVPYSLQLSSQHDDSKNCKQKSLEC